MNPNYKKLVRTILTAVGVGVLGFLFFTLILQPVFAGNVLIPQSFSIGGFKIQYYGLILGVAALAGYALAMHRREKYQVTRDNADSIIFVSIIAGFIGARLYHVISQYPDYIHQPLNVFAVWNGGLGIFGAAIGGVLAIYFCSKYILKGESSKAGSFLDLLDWLTPSIVIGQLIGRFGNFFNYELYGSATNLPWKMYVPLQFRTLSLEMTQFFHPLFLYEAAGSAIILVLLLKLKLQRGRLFFLWLLLYNVLRFFLEFIRVGSVTYGSIRINAIVSAVLVAVAAAFWYKLGKTDKS